MRSPTCTSRGFDLRTRNNRSCGDARSPDSPKRAAPDNQRESRRRGFSLVELSVVIAVSSMIISSMVVSLHRMYRADRDARDDLAASASLMRLSTQFRSDAHAAQTVNHAEGDDTPGGANLVMNLSDGQTIEYAAADSSIERIKRRGEVVIHRDLFQLRRDASVRMLLQLEQQAQVAVIAIFTGRKPAAEERLVYRIEAVIGLDQVYDREAEE